MVIGRALFICFASAPASGRARRIHTALDTCGAAPAEELLRVSAQADLVRFDVKLLDGDLHAAHTGAPNADILENLRALTAAGRSIVVRYPLMYHRMGADKYKRLGLARDWEDIAEHDAAEIAGMLRGEGLEVGVGGKR